jgi:hypothetical protein
MQQKLNNSILIIFLVLFCNSNVIAANNKIQLNDVKNNVYNIKKNISKWINNEWHKTVEYQKDGFNQMKIQTENTKNGINKPFNAFK